MNVKLLAIAFSVVCAPSFAVAQDVTWGCTFNKFTGVTTCQPGARIGANGSSGAVVSAPNVGIPGTAVSIYGETVRVYLYQNGTGQQKFHWQD